MAIAVAATAGITGATAAIAHVGTSTQPVAAPTAAVSAPAPAPTSASPSATPSRSGSTPASRGGTRTTKASPSPTKTRVVVSSGTCGASFYDEPQQTANGETFDPDALTAASKTIAFDTRVRVTSLDTGKSVIVRINDRGPYISGRCLDLSRAAFDVIDDLDKGAVRVRYDILK
ncbi:MAG: septal ring lytic transglycosylase RlpA family protein [Hamadaea sp.]|nr:septal ring lytic transglycosylase RlpA family protein [Hamadaea sp.]NUR48796.1 septal ring lytic transglycosylase RlpA family protein [Hamadaea sp.]NUT07712.1 septal ring lytic transglycosylase RlpA family protein [Hamadaea sp.]